MSQHVATVVITAPESEAGRTVVVGPNGVMLGRDAACDLVLPGEQVSRRHAAVRTHGDHYLVEDLNSLNGTSLNGRPFTGAVALRDGDRLELADVEVEFRLTMSSGVPPSQPQPSAGTPWSHNAPTQPTGSLGTTLTCGSVTITSTGMERLEITDIELVNNPGDFAADEATCEGSALTQGETCQFTVVFAPQAPGDRSATLLIHQNLPPPDTGTSVQVVGSGEG